MRASGEGGGLPHRHTFRLPVLGREVTRGLFDRLVIAGVALGFVVLLAVGSAAAWAVRQNQVYSQLVAHTLEVETAISDFRINIEQAEAIRRGYLLTGESRFDILFRSAIGRLPVTIETLQDLTADNPVQQNRVATLRSLVDQHRLLSAASMAKVRSGRRDEAIADFAKEQNRLMQPIRQVTSDMGRMEAGLLAERADAQQASTVLVYVTLAFGGLMMVLVGAGSIFIILRYTHDLAASRDSLRELNAGLEDAVRDRTSDLTRANDEIQRFAYIVSHDLRSPLVNVMGFTSELSAAVAPLHELVTRAEAEAPDILSKAAREAIEVDLPEAIGFIRTSTQKMDRLINAILRLSREGRRVLTPERLDVGLMSQGIRASLKHRLDELGAEVVIDEPLPSIVSDRLALEQILSNLVENAVKYAAPGRPVVVTVSGREELGRVIYDVRDNGRGIDPKDHERIFELFRRSGAQDQPGEGIGLAHVRALAYRLGGLINVESQLDQGATFRLSLPAKLTLDQTGPS